MNRLTTVAARRVRGTLLCATVAATAMTGPVWAASSGSTGATTTTTTITPAPALAVSVAATGPHTLPASLPPAALRADLRRLRGMAPERRQQTAARIWQDALGGDYGSAVQLRAERVQQRYRLLPGQLRNDLGELRGLGGDELRDGLVAVRDKALDGGYGDQVRQRAERHGDFWQQG
ncbi:hypothetical protein [Streptomyces cylindrosporus]|uniref:Uncharacterized protein n=1 Tax=Streptomyces cylindrosporus TaxID=2927583 RepID=A0ABS9YJC3_9ACTN|nr:hypothetical protein [Streptomyces cylindrosporus]MCI3276686.1 hypothetical protein [Streptomyces cylindrosporus]